MYRSAESAPAVGHRPCLLRPCRAPLRSPPQSAPAAQPWPNRQRGVNRNVGWYKRAHLAAPTERVDKTVTSTLLTEAHTHTLSSRTSRRFHYRHHPTFSPSLIPPLTSLLRPSSLLPTPPHTLTTISYLVRRLSVPKYRRLRQVSHRHLSVSARHNYTGRSKRYRHFQLHISHSFPPHT